MTYVPTPPGHNRELDTYRNILDSTSKRIGELALSGLRTDGAHHKQYYLEQIALYLVGEENFSKLKQEFQWENGIEP